MLIDSSVSVQAPLPRQLQQRLTLTASTEAIPFWSGQNGKLQVVMSATVNCYVEFGTSSMSAATSANGHLLLAGKRYLFTVTRGDTHFRAIRQAADGLLTWYVPGSPVAPGLQDIVPDIGVTPLALWDARAGLGFAGTGVDTWTDQIGGIVLTATSSSTRPTFGADSTNFNNLPVLHFDGVDDSLKNTSVSLYAAESQPHFVYVARAKAAGANYCLASFGSADAASIALAFRTAGNGTLGWWFDVSGQVGTVPLVDTNTFMFETYANVDNDFLVAKQNGYYTTTGLAVATTGPCERIYIGNDRETFTYANIALAAVIVYPAALTAAQGLALHAHLRSVYNVPAMP